MMNIRFEGKSYLNWVVPVLCLGLAFSHGLFLYGGSSGHDDVYITYWAAKALGDFGKIINYNGEALEQSSSLLHVMMLTILYKVSGIPLPILGVFLSATMGGLTILAAWRLAVFLKIRSAWFVALFCALFPYLVYWSFGGLETTLVAFIAVLLVYSVILYLTQKISLFLCIFAILSISAYIIARPEAIFVVLAFLIGIALYFLAHNLLLKKRSDFTYGKFYYIKLMILVGISLAIFTVLSFWRYEIFGQIFPQPVYAKTSGLQLSKFLPGIGYFFKQYWLPSLVILTGLTVFAINDTLRHHTHERKSAAFAIVISFMVATLAFVVSSGGDWMEGGRFFVPMLPLLVISGLYAVSRLPKLLGTIVLVFLTLSASIETAKFLAYESRGIPLLRAKAVYSPVWRYFELSEEAFSWFEKVNRPHLRDIPFIVMLDTVVKRLLAAQSEQVTILSHKMGMVPFYIAKNHFGKVELIDRAGITSNHFTRCNVTRHLTKAKYGLRLGYRYLFSHFNEIQSKCNIKPPAIIYDLNEAGGRNLVEKKGYRIVYAQSGFIVAGYSWVRRKQKVHQYLAVRADLLKRVGKLEPRFYQWPSPKYPVK
jgi:hypothetical protein